MERGTSSGGEDDDPRGRTDSSLIQLAKQSVGIDRAPPAPGRESFPSPRKVGWAFCSTPYRICWQESYAPHVGRVCLQRHSMAQRRLPTGSLACAERAPMSADG